MKLPPVAMLQSCVLGKTEQRGSGMPMWACTVNMATCLTASKERLNRGGEDRLLCWGPWRLCGYFTGIGTGGVCGPLLAQTQVTPLLLMAVSMLCVLGHPAHQLPSDSDSRNQTFLGWVGSRPGLKPGGLRLCHTGWQHWCQHGQLRHCGS